MRTPDQILADARGGSAFSNSSQFEYWASNRGCWTCRNDDAETEKWCPILGVALSSGKTPAEWVTFSEKDEIYGNYTCTEYDERRDDDGDDDGSEPDPTPGPAVELEGQIDMFEVFAEKIADDASVAQTTAVTR
jgi:hypothetical protein